MHAGKICEQVVQEWAVTICHNRRPGQLKNVPSYFTILDRDAIDILKGHTTFDGKTRYDHVSRMKLVIGEPETVCDEPSEHCTAAVAISPRLLAIWSTWLSAKSRETASAAGLRQGRAIKWFVDSQIGNIRASLPKSPFKKADIERAFLSLA